MYGGRRNQANWEFVYANFVRAAIRKWRNPNSRNKILLVVSIIASLIIILLLSQQIVTRDEKLLRASHSLADLQEYFNKATPIFNQDRFTLEPGFIPIVIYVYKRPHYLQRVLEALSQVRGIDKTMIIVSHDSTMPEMLDLVKNVNFCQVKQLLHPVSPNRESNAQALKDHWYWLQSTLWNDLFPDRSGDICFIEEDHLVSIDFYETLKVLSSMKHSGIVPSASTVALGSYFVDPSASPSTVVSFQGFMNTGYAFNRTLWQFIKQYETIFNATDDDWDTSLAEGLINPKLIPDRQITPHLSRVCNIGSAGGLHKTQIIANLCEQGLYPVSKGIVDWNDLVLFSLGDNPNEQQNQINNLHPREICSGKYCVDELLWQKLTVQ